MALGVFASRLFKTSAWNNIAELKKELELLKRGRAENDKFKGPFNFNTDIEQIQDRINVLERTSGTRKPIIG